MLFLNYFPLAEYELLIEHLEVKSRLYDLTLQWEHIIFVQSVRVGQACLRLACELLDFANCCSPEYS